MRTVTIREPREGLPHVERLFADGDEVLVTRRVEPLARILPKDPAKPVLGSLRDVLANQPLQTIPSEVLLAEEREDCC